MNEETVVDNNSTDIEELYFKFTNYLETRFALLKLMAINKVSGFLSTFVSMIILLMILFTVIFCISIGLAILIGQALGASYYGFFIVAGFYLIIGLIIFLVRGKILKTPVSNKLIKEMID